MSAMVMVVGRVSEVLGSFSRDSRATFAGTFGETMMIAAEQDRRSTSKITPSLTDYQAP